MGPAHALRLSPARASARGRGPARPLAEGAGRARRPRRGRPLQPDKPRSTRRKPSDPERRRAHHRHGGSPRRSHLGSRRHRRTARGQAADTRQLARTPAQDRSDTLRVDSFALHARGASTSELLKVIRENPAALVDDPKREIRTFRLILGAPMGSKRGQGKGSFVTSVLDLLDGFYEDVIQSIKPWSAAPPKLRPSAPDPPEPTVPARACLHLALVAGWSRAGNKLDDSGVRTFAPSARRRGPFCSGRSRRAASASPDHP